METCLAMVVCTTIICIAVCFCINEIVKAWRDVKMYEAKVMYTPDSDTVDAYGDQDNG